MTAPRMPDRKEKRRTGHRGTAFLHSLGFRVSLVVGLAFAAGLALQLYLSMEHHINALLKLKKEEATLVSDTIKQSLAQAMLQGERGRETIQRVIKDVARREEIERVRVFNAVGDIRYASDPAERGRTVDKEAENCKQCHTGSEPPDPQAFTDRSRFFYTPRDSKGSRYRVLGVINPIRNDPERGCVECHRGQSVLGVLDVVVSLKNLDEEIAGHRGLLLAAGILGVAGVALVVGILIQLLVHRPVGKLLDGVRKVGSLDLDYRIPADRKDELGNLARAFNDMTARLQQAQARIREFTDRLEEKISEKSAELEKAQRQMLRSEKMAAIGQMAAGVAHEINNPLTGVITFAHLLRRKTEPGSPEQEDLDTIITEAERCSKIVRGLLDFARGGQLVRSEADVNRLLDRTLALVENQALFHNIEVVREYDPDLPLVPLDQDRIQQVVLNLVVNAAEAMESGGRLTLRTGVTRTDGAAELRIEVRDSGPGIDPEVRSRVFDPFFTTKDVGKGTGLGLAVSYRIVDDHGGRIAVSSPPGEGASFTVILPIREENPES